MKRILLFLSCSILLVAGGAATSCSGSGDDTPPPGPGAIVVTDISIPAAWGVAPGSEITIGGKGFTEGDKLSLQSRSVSGVAFTIENPTIVNDGITFRLPDGIESGDYTVSVLRGGQHLELGTITLEIIVRIDIPDKAGMNVKGLISCGDAPLSGVCVSDGIQVTRTGADGIYYLNSAKKNGYLFISLPGGYEVPVNKSVPQFFKRLTRSASEIERLDFALTAVPNDKHTMIVFTDVHLAGRNDDRTTFYNGFLKEIKQSLLAAESTGGKIYCMALGDLAWDLYWYSNAYNLSNYRTEIGALDCAVFSAPGNHDNDPYIGGDDWRAAGPFRQIMGPNYFSFNIGKVHYIMLDDVEYVNTGGTQGTIGKRNYNATVVAEQMEWLKQDLATLSDKSLPVVVGMHVPFYKKPTVDAAGTLLPFEPRLDNTAELKACFDGFTDVSFLSGHTHFNFNIREGNIREHNIAAVCATWWWTSKSNYDAHNEICVDGSPGGYKVFEMDGTKAGWYYKGTGKARDYQFRTYDLNQVLITAARYCPQAVSNPHVAEYLNGYDTANTKNEVLINVWDWDPSWTLSVTESPGGKPLTPVRVNAYDPLHVISYNMQRFKYSPDLTSPSFPTAETSHMFKVTASSPASTLEITAINGSGVKYTQTMTRPKELDFQMQ
jgi:hypothetical protein